MHRFYRGPLQTYIHQLAPLSLPNPSKDLHVRKGGHCKKPEFHIHVASLKYFQTDYWQRKHKCLGGHPEVRQTKTGGRFPEPEKS